MEGSQYEQPAFRRPLVKQSSERPHSPPPPALDEEDEDRAQRNNDGGLTGEGVFEPEDTLILAGERRREWARGVMSVTERSVHGAAISAGMLTSSYETHVQLLTRNQQQYADERSIVVNAKGYVQHIEGNAAVRHMVKTVKADDFVHNPHAPPPVEPSWSSSEDEGPRRPRETVARPPKPPKSTSRGLLGFGSSTKRLDPAKHKPRLKRTPSDTGSATGGSEGTGTYAESSTVSLESFSNSVMFKSDDPEPEPLEPHAEEEDGPIDASSSPAIPTDAILVPVLAAAAAPRVPAVVQAPASQSPRRERSKLAPKAHKPPPPVAPLQATRMGLLANPPTYLSPAAQPQPQAVGHLNTLTLGSGDLSEGLRVAGMQGHAKKGGPPNKQHTPAEHGIILDGIRALAQLSGSGALSTSTSLNHNQANGSTAAGAGMSVGQLDQKQDSHRQYAMYPGGQGGPPPNLGLGPGSAAAPVGPLRVPHQLSQGYASAPGGSSDGGAAALQGVYGSGGWGDGGGADPARGAGGGPGPASASHANGHGGMHGYEEGTAGYGVDDGTDGAAGDEARSEGGAGSNVHAGPHPDGSSAHLELGEEGLGLLQGQGQASGRSGALVGLQGPAAVGGAAAAGGHPMAGVGVGQEDVSDHAAARNGDAAGASGDHSGQGGAGVAGEHGAAGALDSEAAGAGAGAPAAPGDGISPAQGRPGPAHLSTQLSTQLSQEGDAVGAGSGGGASPAAAGPEANVEGPAGQGPLHGQGQGQAGSRPGSGKGAGTGAPAGPQSHPLSPSALASAEASPTGNHTHHHGAWSPWGLHGEEDRTAHDHHHAAPAAGLGAGAAGAGAGGGGHGPNGTLATGPYWTQTHKVSPYGSFGKGLLGAGGGGLVTPGSGPFGGLANGNGSNSGSAHGGSGPLPPMPPGAMAGLYGHNSPRHQRVASLLGSPNQPEGAVLRSASQEESLQGLGVGAGPAGATYGGASCVGAGGAGHGLLPLGTTAGLGPGGPSPGQQLRNAPGIMMQGMLRLGGYSEGGAGPGSTGSHGAAGGGAMMGVAGGAGEPGSLAYPGILSMQGSGGQGYEGFRGSSGSHPQGRSLGRRLSLGSGAYGEQQLPNGLAGGARYGEGGAHGELRGEGSANSGRGFDLGDEEDLIRGVLVGGALERLLLRRTSNVSYDVGPSAQASPAVVSGGTGGDRGSTGGWLPRPSGIGLSPPQRFSQAGGSRGGPGSGPVPQVPPSKLGGPGSGGGPPGDLLQLLSSAMASNGGSSTYGGSTTGGGGAGGGVTGRSRRMSGPVLGSDLPSASQVPELPSISSKGR